MNLTWNKQIGKKYFILDPVLSSVLKSECQNVYTFNLKWNFLNNKNKILN